jgi:hypothetical protein
MAPALAHLFADRATFAKKQKAKGRQLAAQKRASIKASKLPESEASIDLIIKLGEAK